MRGYRENQLVKDNGVAASLEFRVPVSDRFGELQLTSFIEGGLGWDNGNLSDVQGLASIGVGLQWDIDENFRLRADYGYPLTNVQQDGNTLQDDGIYLSIDWAFDD